MEKVETLRKKYPTFVYKDYSYKISENNLEIFFVFEVPPDITFHPRIIIHNISQHRFRKIKKEVLDNLVFHLGLMESLSYWKAACSPYLEIQTEKVTRNQIIWFKEFLLEGMGQFFYENKIKWQKPDFLKVVCTKSGKSSLALFARKSKGGILIPVGGGKDSAVTLELLKRSEMDITCFSLNPTKNAQDIMNVFGCNNPIIVDRKIDTKLLELNRNGFLNGHTPFSAYLAFLTILIAALFDKKFIALSNERSSNESSLKYLGREINHQYSKSFEFEKKFSNYSQHYLAKNIRYFSFLRPLYELQVAKIFSRYEKYFSAFMSCNEAYKTASGTKTPAAKWCTRCSKCLFVFAILYPFIDKETMVKIFGKNLFEEKELLNLMKKLIGIKRNKPLECVGTRKESLVAFYLSWKKANRVGESPFLLRYFEEKVIPWKIRKGFVKGLSQYAKMEKETKELMTSWNKKHNVPKELIKYLEKKLILDKSYGLF